MDDLIPIETPMANTCTNCGQPLGEVCWATSVDAAKSGAAWCVACAVNTSGPVADPEPEPVKTPRKSRAK